MRNVAVVRLFVMAFLVVLTTKTAYSAPKFGGLRDCYLGVLSIPDPVLASEPRLVLSGKLETLGEPGRVRQWATTAVWNVASFFVPKPQLAYVDPKQLEVTHPSYGGFVNPHLVYGKVLKPDHFISKMSEDIEAQLNQNVAQRGCTLVAVVRVSRPGGNFSSQKWHCYPLGHVSLNGGFYPFSFLWDPVVTRVNASGTVAAKFQPRSPFTNFNFDPEQMCRILWNPEQFPGAVGNPPPPPPNRVLGGVDGP